MMDKILQFGTHDNLGRCFAEALDISPRYGAGHEKIAGELSLEIKKFLRTIKPDPRYQYVLMTPMGAYEYWGMNVNGDIFPEIALSHCHRDSDPVPVMKELERKYLLPFGKRLPPVPMKDFGFRTFENALRYKHHVNKDPSIAYGDIAFVTYNKGMHRVELIVRHDREAAKRVGAEEIIRDLDEGKPRQISMGCKVPFDVCTICGNVSKTPRDYCIHLKSEMGTIRPDGKIVGAVNFFPRFFDLSDVFVPAAKESGVIMKVASALPAPEAEKVSSTKKLAEMKKNTLPNAVSESIMKMRDHEPDLPLHMFRDMNLSKLLTTLGMLGIVAKPREFQYGLLHKMNRGDLAEKFRQKNIIFNPSHHHGHEGGFGVRSSDYSPGIARLLQSFISKRSGFFPHLPDRVVRIMIIKVKPRVETVSDEGILNKVASVYNSYRKSLETLAPELDTVIEKDFKFFSKNFFSDVITNSMSKTAEQSLIKNGHIVPMYFKNVYYNTNDMPSTKRHLPKLSTARALLGPSF
tara:strand:+ start:5009 stop:6565 length:1557 start_codon:yes stop_codon:yes gene_type:complete